MPDQRPQSTPTQTSSKTSQIPVRYRSAGPANVRRAGQGPARAHRTSRGGAGLSLGLAVLGVALVALAGVLFLSGGLILPGVEVMGIGLGGKTAAAAARALESEWQGKPIALEGAGTTWTVSPDMLGLFLDSEATVRRAREQGRTWATLKEMLRARGRIALTPVWRFERSAAAATLRVLAAQIQVPAQNAGVRVVEGRVEPSPPVAGRALDVVATVAWLAEHGWDAWVDGRVSLVVVPITPAIADVGPAIAQAQQLLANRITLNGYDAVTDERFAWTATPAILGEWLALQTDRVDATKMDWQVDPAKVEAFLAAQAATLGPGRTVDLSQGIPAITEAVMAQRSTVRLRIRHRERQHTVKSGETLSSIGYDYGIPYPWILQANKGLGETLHVGQVITIPSPDVLIPLPVVENKRVVVSLGQQKMWAYENGALKWEWQVSTGIESSPTAPGVFQVQSHDPNAYAAQWELWMPYFMGIYRPVPTTDFMNGFHGFPTRDGSQLLWTRNLGKPVTFGCILVSTENVTQLYQWAEEGVVVEVRK
ncbi:MAG: L,D-transpeptidase family protein [Anaerolineae bacterium]|nr:L,D-transpeptidase family protein [Anaerolineae bacterium]